MISSLVLLLVMGAAHAAEAYKCKGKNGVITYSDTPCANAEIVPLHDAQGYAPVTLTPLPSTTGNVANANKPVKLKVTISSPTAGQVFNDNEGKVSIAAQVLPGLPDEHKLHLMMDGKELRSGELTNVDRGEHTVTATVTDGKGRTVASSDALRFVMQKQSALHSVMLNPYQAPKKRPKTDK